LYGRRYLGGIVDLGELVLPRSIDGQMLGDIADYSPQLLAVVIARTLLMHIAKGTLDWLFIMHLQDVGSHNHTVAGGLRLRAV